MPVPRVHWRASRTPSLTDYIWSRLATKEQRARMRMFIPTEYSNFLDPDGFIMLLPQTRTKTQMKVAFKSR